MAQITSNKLAHYQAYLRAKKRGGGHVRGESALEKPGEPAAHLSAEHPVPIILDGEGEEASEFDVESEEFRRLLDLLPDDTYRFVALRRLEGIDSIAIGKEIGCHYSTVQRKLNRIYRIWSKELTS